MGVNPATSGFEDIDDPRNDASIINTGNAANFVGQMRFKSPKLFLRKPK